MSAIGTTRQFGGAQRTVAFEGKADIDSKGLPHIWKL
jgi:hypothetical protein